MTNTQALVEELREADAAIGGVDISHIRHSAASDNGIVLAKAVVRLKAAAQKAADLLSAIPVRGKIAAICMQWRMDGGGDWPMEKAEGGTAYISEAHDGDCTRKPWTCMRCEAEMAYKQADQILAILPPASGGGVGWRPTHRHLKRGTTYQVIGEAELQQAGQFGPVEGDRLTVYRGEDGKLWVRATSEFDDGRFEPRPAPPTDGGERPSAPVAREADNAG